MALSQAQLDALASGEARGKLCLRIDTTTPLLYCSGTEPVYVDSEWYQPRTIRGNYFELTRPSRAKCNIVIDDRDEEISGAWYTERFSGFEAEVHILLSTRAVPAWTTAASVTWRVEAGSETGTGDFQVRLFAAGGNRKRFGLVVGDKSRFPHCPEPDTLFRFGPNTARVREVSGAPYWVDQMIKDIEDPPTQGVKVDDVTPEAPYVPTTEEPDEPAHM